jgi:NTP pyrophosphatase (non-canonical NTP hydrolase)
VLYKDKKKNDIVFYQIRYVGIVTFLTFENTVPNKFIYLYTNQHPLTMTDIDAIQAELRKFNQERDWDQFHNGKDLAIGLSIEASELLECFLWKNPEDASIDKIKEELADVLNFAFQMADKYGLDIKQIMLEKLQRNAQKYPVEKARGSAKKYDEL